VDAVIVLIGGDDDDAVIFRVLHGVS